MTTLLYLHGVGDDGSRRDWWDTLRTAAGDDLSGVEVLAPDFSDLLAEKHTAITHLPLPARTLHTESPINRREYRAAQAELHTRLVAAGSRSLWPLRRRGFARVPGMIDAIGEKIVMDVIFEEVGKYIDEGVRRRAILDRVLRTLPDTDEDVIIIGHSLGALVALDLIMHLPDNITVPLLVTAASALARRRLPPDVAELPTTFPFDRVGVWINVFNPADPVTRGLPIGMRFPQAIDVSVDAGFADHNLAACLVDPGVAQAIALEVHRASISAQPSAVIAVRPTPAELTRAQAVELATVQMALHMETLLALRPDTSVEVLEQFMMARRVAGERSALRSYSRHHEWDRDHSQALLHGIAEPDIPAVLVRIAGVNPLEPFKITVPREVVVEARRKVATDIGVPPAWVDVAGRSLVEATAVFRPMRRKGRRSGDGAENNDDPADALEALHITDSVRRSLAPVAALDSLAPSKFEAGLGDIRPVCIELLARALTAHRLGTLDAGAEERTVLSRLMVVLGDHRARVSSQLGSHERLLAELRRRTATVAQSLSWLAAQGVGLSPGR